ncbi:kynureninase [Novosphingopyxis sp.]|uniref:kynureninase n=1 Tax=Novosphingopyxis sp. TaxID=2709690 RepID=UPI003B5C7BE6
MTIDLTHARALDAADPLAPFRNRFQLPDGIIYLDGNSLGPLPRATIERQRDMTTRQWGDGLIRSWNDADWIDAPARIGAKIARLIGAKPHEVLVADSVSVNIFKLLVAACRLSPERTQMLSEAGNFHTDLHIASGAAELLADMRLDVVERGALAGAIGADTNVALLTHVHYKTAERFDMAALTAKAQAAGARIVWDLSHSVGAVPLDLNGCGAELAVGCGYKYLNGGPGAPAFLYVAEALQDRLLSPLRGWFGHARPFAFEDRYEPAPGIARFQAGTPPMLSMDALEGGIASFDGVDMADVWEKSIKLFALFETLAAQHCEELSCISPSDPGARGSHISFRFDHAYELCQALIAAGVIGDFRAPDIIRFGLTPLYLGYEDVARAVAIMAEILDSGRYKQPRFAERGRVT